MGLPAQLADSENRRDGNPAGYGIADSADHAASAISSRSCFAVVSWLYCANAVHLSMLAFFAAAQAHPNFTFDPKFRR